MCLIVYLCLGCLIVFNCFSIGFDFVFTSFRNVFVCVWFFFFLIIFKLFLNWVVFELAFGFVRVVVGFV